MFPSFLSCREDCHQTQTTRQQNTQPVNLSRAHCHHQTHSVEVRAWIRGREQWWLSSPDGPTSGSARRSACCVVLCLACKFCAICFRKKSGRQYRSCSRDQRKGPYAAALSGSLALEVSVSPVCPLTSPLVSTPSPVLALEKGSVRQGQKE
ncbi:hypothetical protein BJV77DRAFT_112261 [Russula vinacea]|nr:hypothetical protein BJV77DRAFT_112261 [Russula vinacea]